MPMPILRFPNDHSDFQWLLKKVLIFGLFLIVTKKKMLRLSHIGQWFVLTKFPLIYEINWAVAKWLIFNEKYFENSLGQIPFSRFLSLYIQDINIEGLPIVWYNFRSRPLKCVWPFWNVKHLRIKINGQFFWYKVCSIFYRSSYPRGHVKKLFIKISQYSQGNNCVGVSF